MNEQILNYRNSLSKEIGLCRQEIEELRIASRALKTTRYCNQLLVRATKEKELLNGICKIIIEDGGYLMAWIGFSQQNNKKTVKPVAVSGVNDGYIENLNISWGDTKYGRGPTGIAIRTGKAIGVSDILNESDYNPWRAQAVKRGYASSIALPLIFNKHILGALSIYAKEKNAFNDEEKKLLFELADNLSYGVMAIRLRLEHHREHHKMQYQIEDVFAYTIGALARAAEANDEDTGNHILRVGQYCALIAEKLKMPNKFIKTIRLQAELHDVGKIHVPSPILQSPKQLTTNEWEQMKKHPIYGAQIVGTHPYLKVARTVALTHHEKWDGSGYPYGLNGKDIPIEGRIIALADQYDAMRNQRVYKPPLSHDDTYKAIIYGDGRTKPSDFDPDVLLAFKEIHLAFDQVYEVLRNGSLIM